MQFDAFWAALVVNLLAGMLAGGITNHVAVWMLFHPHTKRFGIQGAIPKNKARLAKSLGRTVGERLLTPGDLVGELSRAGVRDAFDQRVNRFIADIFETERPSVAEMLPPQTVASLRDGTSELAGSIAAQMELYLDSEDFAGRVQGFVSRARTELERRDVGDLLSPTQREELAERALRWAAEFAQSPELERGVREYLERQAERLLTSDAPLISRIPQPVLQAIEAAIESYLPLAAGRLGAFLSHPASREKVRASLHNLFQRFVRDLEFHQRLIAKLLVTERTLDRIIDTMETDGVEQIASLLDDPDVRAELTVTLREAILSFLSKPLREILAGASRERALTLAHAAGDFLLRVLHDERTHVFLQDRIRGMIAAAEGKPVADFVSGLSDEMVTRWIVASARGERTRQLLRDGLSNVLDKAVNAKIGRPSRWLPADAATRTSAMLSPALWEWLQQQLPLLVQQLDVESMVERKVQGFSVQRMEEIIRGVTERELRLIVKLGYVLGAVIGLMTFTVARLMG